MRLTLSPKSVTDVEGVRDVALSLKAAKKLVSSNGNSAAAAASGSGKSAENKKDEELQPLFPNAPR